MAAPFVEDADETLENDYYSLLNVSREATKSEIDQAYKRLCRIYHPDKHFDPVKKKNAGILFAKLKRAHEVLSDEHKRVLYNLYGEKGLESYKMEVVTRTKTPAEIIAEYERFQAEAEERRLQQATNPRSYTEIAINATDIFEPYPYDEEEEEYVRRIPTVEITGMKVQVGVQCPLTQRDTCDVVVDSSSSMGTHVLMTSWERRVSHNTSFKIGTLFGAQNGLTFQYSRQLAKNFWCNVHTKLSYDVSDEYLRVGSLSLGSDVSYRFDKHWVGRMHWNVIKPTNISTVISYESERQSGRLQLVLGLLNRYIVTSYTRRFEEHHISTTLAVKVGKFHPSAPIGVIVKYGIQKKITDFSHLGATINVGYPSGVQLQIKSTRGHHVFTIPINLSEELVPSAVLYGTFIPLVTYFAVKKLIVDPYILNRKEKNLEKKRQEHKEKLSEKRRQAEALLELMKETIDRIIANEENRNGLIIISALYGKLSSQQETITQNEDCIDVTLPIQALVDDSTLITPDNTTKCDIPGIYDPCVGEDKRLYIKYKFRRRIHHTVVKDLERIRIPQQKHLFSEDQTLLFTNGNNGT
ncbi:DnaJ (Hsp40) [Mactra antiquata]